jgi:cation:H+ antiporter
VKNAVKISRIVGLGELVAGFIFLSFVSNFPEMAIALSSIFSQNIGIGLGNVLGSNMADICLIVGVIAAMKPIKVGRKSIKKLFIMLFFTSAIPLILIYMRTAGRVVGISLLFLFLYFCYYSSKKKITLGQKRQYKWKASLSKIIGIYFLAMLGVVASSVYVVSSSANIAKALGISNLTIGASIISIGGAIPELIIGIIATKRGHTSLALGDVIGSSFTSVTLVLGLLLLATEVIVDVEVFSTIVMFFLVSCILLWLFFGRGEIDRIEGIVLVFVYIAFLITIFGVQITLLQILK